MTDRDKHWDFHVHEHEVEATIAPVIADIYPDEHEKRTTVLASWLSGQMNCGAIDFAHDPEWSDDPAVEASEITDAFARLFDDSDKRFGWKAISVYFGDHAGEHDHRLLFRDPDPYGFAQPYNVETLARRVADALVAAVADGRVEVTADEPYDSCRGCGGYHNVNYDCSDSDY